MDLEPWNPRRIGPQLGHLHRSTFRRCLDQGPPRANPPSLEVEGIGVLLQSGRIVLRHAAAAEVLLSRLDWLWSARGTKNILCFSVTKDASTPSSCLM